MNKLKKSQTDESFVKISTSNPTSSNDTTEKFDVGSQWFNSSTQTLYVCTDATEGSAVWVALSGGSNSTIISENQYIPVWSEHLNPSEATSKTPALVTFVEPTTKRIYTTHTQDVASSLSGYGRIIRSWRNTQGSYEYEQGILPPVTHSQYYQARWAVGNNNVYVLSYSAEASSSGDYEIRLVTYDLSLNEIDNVIVEDGTQPFINKRLSGRGGACIAGNKMLVDLNADGASDKRIAEIDLTTGNIDNMFSYSGELFEGMFFDDTTSTLYTCRVPSGSNSQTSGMLRKYTYVPETSLTSSGDVNYLETILPYSPYTNSGSSAERNSTSIVNASNFSANAMFLQILTTLNGVQRLNVLGVNKL